MQAIILGCLRNFDIVLMLTSIFMKIYKWKYLLLGVLVALTLGFYLPRENEDGNRKDKVILNLVYNVLNSSHFAPQEINDEFSEKVISPFL